MKYYLDTEFLEGKQREKFPINLFRKETPETIDLISIGIVAEDGREYYAISKDFNLKEAWNRWQQRTGEGDRNKREPKEYWIRENILKPIFEEWIKKDSHWTNKDRTHGKWKFTYDNFKWHLDINGKTNKQIAEEIAGKHNPMSFIKRKGQIGGGTPVEFYAYYADYDWVVFCWLFGRMIDLPYGFPMYCIDLKQIMDKVAKKVTNSAIKLQLGIPNNACIQEPTLKEKIGYLKRIPSYPIQVNEHNALADARWNKELHKFLNEINIKGRGKL